MVMSFSLVGICAFALGTLFGGAMVMMYFSSLVVKALKLMAGTDPNRRATGTSHIADDLAKMPTDKRERIMNIIKEVAQVSEMQAGYMGTLAQPSKNALHSKFKNDIIRQVKDLEGRKVALFKEILKEGYDPELPNTLPDGTQNRIKMSQAIAEYEAREGTSVKPMPTPKPATVVKMSDTPSEGAKILQFVRPSKKE